ncbi:MAG: hypothetical protein ACM3ML_38185 [Micromonosporaceae bacterium]
MGVPEEVAVTGGATRRSVIAALAVVPVTAPLFAAEGCGVSAAPEPTAKIPSDASILASAIAAKKKMIALYTSVSTAHPSLAPHLRPLLHDNDAHLQELQRRLIHPAAAHPGNQASPRPGPPAAPRRRAAALAALRAAEAGAAAVHIQQLQTVAPSFAQLLASIAACEATHAALLAKAARSPVRTAGR